MKPSDFTRHPWNSVVNEYESEIVAVNIMKILKRTGNRWRWLTWEEYEREREKDGDLQIQEKEVFENIRNSCYSAKSAQEFCGTWAL